MLVTAVTLGRRTHGNSIKYIKMAASSNFGNCFSLLVAAAWLPFLPADALQLLVQGLLYDISQLAIPFDRMDKDWLKKPQPWSGGNLVTFMVRHTVTGGGAIATQTHADMGEAGSNRKQHGRRVRLFIVLSDL